MPDAHYEVSKLAELYDLDSPWSIDRDFYLSLAGQNNSVLDLGCGTGLLCNAYAERGHTVTGVDPSAAMLEVGRKKPHGDKIDWVQSSAQDYKSDKLFDLIIMTGHAFQVLLEDSAVQAALNVMFAHLKPKGALVFESRNPQLDWTKDWDYTMTLELPSGIVVQESRQFLTMKNERMCFELRYEFPDQTLTSHSELRFLSRDQIEEKLTDTGFCIDKLFGDWDCSPFDEQSSKEMIFVARHSF